MGEVIVVAQVGESIRLDRGDLRPVQPAIAIGVLFLDDVGAEHLVELPVVPHAHQHAVLEQEGGHGVDPDMGMCSRRAGGSKRQPAASDCHSHQPTQRSGYHRANSAKLGYSPVQLDNPLIVNQMLHGYLTRSTTVACSRRPACTARAMPAGNDARMHRVTVFIVTAFRCDRRRHAVEATATPFAGQLTKRPESASMAEGSGHVTPAPGWRGRPVRRVGD